ncbi:hypothetical protein ACP70R_040260 [Stipagrostis hirtigluma subsp. patula]
MAQPRSPFDFDLNELPPQEEDDAGDASPKPARDSSPQDRLPPPPPVLGTPARDSSPQDRLPPPPPLLGACAPLPPPPPTVENDGDRDDASPAAAREPTPEDQLPPPPPLLGEYAYLPPPPPYPPPASVLYGGARGALPAPAREDSPQDPPSSPVLDLEAPLSPLDEDDDDEDNDADAARPSPETSAPRVSSRGTSDGASSHRSRHRPPYAGPRDDAISRRRGVDDDDEDAGSSRSGSRRTRLTPPRHHGPNPRSHAPPAVHGQPGPGAPRKNWRRRPRRPQQRGHDGQDQRRQEQRGRGPHLPAFRGPERPQAGYQGQYGPQAHAGPKFSAPQQGGYSSFRPPPAGPRGREDPHHGRQGQVQRPPKDGGYHHHQQQQHREAHAFRPPHGREDSPGGRRQIPAQEPPPNGGYHQRREAPRGHAPARPYYHPYARDGGGGFDRADAGNQSQARHAPRPNHQRRRDGTRSASGGPARGRQYYGDVQR